MFRKLLIANRGEIACRIIRTARRMGIATVAVHSEADADALHVAAADEAVEIGPAAAARSYLAIETIVEACRRTGADAVHPGYGFLSENPAFRTALDEAGITFIGPDAPAIAAMGDKIRSKRLAQEAGVSTVPGHLAPIEDEEEAVEICRAIGYPVMLKASAGGGGKGMRVVGDDRAAREGFRSARNEARTAFGDDRVFAEKYVTDPRHIEIQILGDRHGTILHLGERECSIQRRHQKILEEAPSPFLDAGMRAAMGAQAVALARAVDYVSAGTVEFIVGADRAFYFLEMNTRLQVEHPVTEMVTGLDLVELMIRIAAGEPIGLTQADIALRGWAVEARIYAEDPYRGFLPSTGRLVRYRPPPESEGAVRLDGGVVEGGEISMHYDPMIAKLIGAGPDRAAAIAALSGALDRFVLRGVGHNIPFLVAVLRHPDFLAGDISTDFVAQNFPEGFTGRVPGAEERSRLLAVAAALLHRRTRREADAVPAPASGARILVVDGEQVPVEIAPGNHGWHVRLDEVEHAVAGDWWPGRPLFEGNVGGVPMVVQVDPLPVGLRLSCGGATIEAVLLSARVAALRRLMPVRAAQDGSRHLLSPMPGLLVSVAVAEGQAVFAGQELAVVEAMKMENVLRAVRDGTVAAIRAKPGDSLAVDQAILDFAP